MVNSEKITEFKNAIISKISSLISTHNTSSTAHPDIRSHIAYGHVDSTSTATAYTATVDGITSLKDGTTILLKNGVVTSAAGFTININGLGAKPVYSNLAAATADTTIFNVNYTMLFVYDETRISGGCWICYRGYDSNTNTIGYQLRTNSAKFISTDKGYKYRLYLQTSDDEFMPVNLSTSTEATSNKSSAMNTREFWIGGQILYNSTNGTIAANSQMNATTLWTQYTLSLGYSFNNTSAALSLSYPKPVYMVAKPTSNGKARLNTPYYTQTIPSTENGLIYILLGYMYSATSLELILEHPVYEYKNGNVRLYREYYTSSEVDGLLDDKVNVADAFSGSYNDLSNKPTIPSKTSQLTNDSGYLTTHQDISGKENSSNKTSTWNATTNNTRYPTEKLVKDSLDNKVDKEAGKSLFSGSYNDLSNKPTIPSKTSQLTNDSGYLTSHQDISGKVDKEIGKGLSTNDYTDAEKTKLANIDTNMAINITKQATADTGYFATYVLSQGGSNFPTKINIPKDFLIKSGSVKTVTTANNPVSGYKVGDKYLDLVINAKDNSATDEHIYVLVSDLVDTEVTWGNVTGKPTFSTVATSGSYNDLSNKPTIPSKTSQLTNDSGYLTSHQDISGKEDKTNKTTIWNPTTNNTRYPTEKLVKDSLDDKADSAHNHTKSEITDFPTAMTPTAHDSTTTEYGVGQTNRYGHVKTVNNLNSTSFANGEALSAYQGAVLKGMIPTSTMDLANEGEDGNAQYVDTERLDSDLSLKSDIGHTHSISNVTDLQTTLDNKISKSSTSGLVKNDGTIDTTQYSTFDSNYNSLSNKPTIPSANSTASNIKMDGTQSAGSATTYAKADHVHPTDTSRAAATHSHTKSEITDFPTSMTPSSHTHGDITNDGAMTTSGVDKDTSDWPIVTDNSDGKKLKRGQIYTGFVWDNYARPNIGTAAQATQTAINAAIDTAIGNKVDTSDSRLSDARNPKTTVITSGDLNNYTTAGFYYCNSNTNAENISNRPSKIKAFYLQVEQWANTNNVKQTISSYHQDAPSPFIYVRTKNGASVWSEWRQVSTYNEAKFVDGETTLTSTKNGTEAQRLADGYVFQNKNNDWVVTGEIKVTGSAARFELQFPGNTDANNHISIGKNTGGNFACWWSTSATAESTHEDSTVTFTNGTWYPFAILKRGNTITWKFNNTKHHQVLTAYVNGLTYLTPQLRKWTTSNVSVRNLRIVPHQYDPLTDVSTATNLNDYKNDGDYLLWSANMSSTTNCPTTQGGLLTVETIPNGVKQTITEYYKANPKIYYRIFHASAGWQNWKEVINSDDSRLSDARTPTSHASTATTYGASSASNYGHAMASSTSPKANGTAAVGSETAKFARGDHVHPHNCVNNLTSTSTTAPLAANQGKVLKNSLTWTQVWTAITSGITLYANDYFCMLALNHTTSISVGDSYIDASIDDIPSAYRPICTVSAPNPVGSDSQSYQVSAYVTTAGEIKIRSPRAFNNIRINTTLIWGRV